MRGVLLLILVSACACATPSTATPSASATRSAAPSSSATRTSTPTRAGTMVQLAEHYYDPSTITVKVGTTVTWVNHGQQTHDVNARDRSFASGNLNPGDTFSYTFTKPGRYPYYCIPHEGDGMTGEVDVE